MKNLITSGGTREYIDDVRVLTNISSGRLGALIAEEALRRGHDVAYVHGIGSIMPPGPSPVDKMFFGQGMLVHHQVKGVSDLMEAMGSYVPRVDAVIHAMAVSDFSFDRTAPAKLKSSDPEGFIEFMRQTICRTPKVLKYIKKWNPEVFLVSFKFEVGLEHDDLVQVAWESGQGALSDAVFANDKSEMDRRGEHVGYLLRVGHGDEGHLNVQSQEVIGKPAIAQAIMDSVEKK